MTEWFNSIPYDVKIVFACIFGFLLVCSVVFGFVHYLKQSELTKELKIRTFSWWKIAIGIVVVATFPKIYGTIVVAYVSFAALREMLSISPLRASDRMAFVLCYLAIPVQFYLAHIGFYNGFIVFIPIIMFILIPTILVLVGYTRGIGRSMSLIPSILILTVFMPSHILMFFHLDFHGFDNGGSGILMYAILLVAFNDVFQYTWGKIFGTKKILPNISPNKTWEGFIFGILTTGVFAYFIQFLVPIDAIRSFGLGLFIGLAGFFGDAILSAIKRDLKIKDTGEVLPGHGGIMDRLDSMVVAVPLYYHILHYVAQNA